MPRIQINLVGTSARVGASWAVTTQWAVSALPTPAAMATALSNIRAALAASTPFRAGVASNYSLVTLKALGYPTPTGHALWTVEAGGSPVAGTGVQLTPPLAIVVSEQTGVAGASYRGRSYWPGAGAGVTSDTGQIIPANQITVRNSWLAVHSAIGAGLVTLGGSPVHVVFSPKTGDMTPIVLIRTGDRVDTARGRFGDAREVYISQAVPLVATVSSVEGSGDVSPLALGLPADATDEEIAAAIRAAITGATPSPLTLGPLDTILDSIGFGLGGRSSD